VLATLLPARRARYSAREVKCATSRYLHRDDGRPAASTAVTAVDIRVHTPPLDLTRPRTRGGPSRPRTHRQPTSRDKVTALLATEPRRAWSGAELAETLQIPKHNMLTQLAEWTRLGFITRTHAGSYALTPSPPRPSIPRGLDHRSEPRAEPATAERPQPGDHGRACAATGAPPAPDVQHGDTPGPASWT
jgi:hypothetical protein